MIFRSIRMLFLVSTYLFIYNVHLMCMVLQNHTIRYSRNIDGLYEMSEVVNKARASITDWVGSINIHFLKSENVKKKIELNKYDSIDNVVSTFTDNGRINKDSTYK